MIFIKKLTYSLLLSFFCLTSFYLTNKIALYVKSQNPILQELNSKYDGLYTLPINSTIIDNTYIIPGINGRELNIDLTFYNIQKNKSNQEENYIFNTIRPLISLEDNKDKIIIRGNPKNKAISLIFESINDNTKYLKENNYEINVLISKEEYDLYYELINNSNNEETYHNIDSFLNKHRMNKYLCLTKNDKIPTICQDKFIIKPSLIINHSNINTIKNNINNGEIILIKDSLTPTDLTLLLNEIKYHELSIKPLSSLIKE